MTSRIILMKQKIILMKQNIVRATRKETELLLREIRK